MLVVSDDRARAQPGAAQPGWLTPPAQASTHAPRLSSASLPLSSLWATAQ